MEKKVDKELAAQMHKAGLSCDKIAEYFGVSKNRIWVILGKIEGKKYGEKLPRCKFNMEIDCDGKGCDCCGWNPKVNSCRIEKLGKKRQVMRFE